MVTKRAEKNLNLFTGEATRSDLRFTNPMASDEWNRLSLSGIQLEKRLDGRSDELIGNISPARH
jgi:hypothetical protein